MNNTTSRRQRASFNKPRSAITHEPWIIQPVAVRGPPSINLNRAPLSHTNRYRFVCDSSRPSDGDGSYYSWLIRELNNREVLLTRLLTLQKQNQLRPDITARQPRTRLIGYHINNRNIVVNYTSNPCTKNTFRKQNKIGQKQRRPRVSGNYYASMYHNRPIRYNL